MDKEFFDQVLRYFLINVVNTAIVLFFLFIFTEFVGIYYVVSSVIAFIIGTVYSYVAARTFTFHSKANLLQSEEKFLLVSVLTFCLNLMLIFLFTDIAGFHFLVSQVLSGAVIFIITFFIHKYWTFRAKPL